MKLKDACSLEGLPLQVDKESVCNVGDSCLIPGLERSPGGGNGNPLQYSCLENAMDRGAWQATVHGVSRVGHDLATKPLPPWKESYDKLDILKSKDITLPTEGHIVKAMVFPVVIIWM